MDWQGSWVGELEIFGRMPRRVAMALDIEPIEPGVWRWRMIYGEGATRQVRDYRLLLRDAEKGRYAIDERNGIVLPAQYLGGVLSERFAVAGALLLTQTRRIGSRLLFEVLSGPREPTANSGGGEVPDVAGYRIAARQAAWLTRVETPSSKN